MKKIELESNKDNLLETMEVDQIGRNECIWSMVELCNSIEECYSVAIDSIWGTGKTFFVKQLKMVLEAYNDHVEIDSNERDRIKKVFEKYEKQEPKEFELQPEFCVYYDAWMHDNDVDPVLSIVYEIIKEYGEILPQKREKGDFSKVLTSISKIVSGRDYGELLETIEGKDVFQEIKNQRKLDDSIRDFFNILGVEKGNRVIIIIDELDRCSPNYSILLLERIKHYFNIESITFIFSVNLKEVRHSIIKHYGDGFDADRYLDRFFDIKLSLPEVDISNYIDCIQDSEELWVENMLKRISICYGFGMREVGKFYSQFRIATRNYNSKGYFNPAYNGERFCMYVIVPLVIALHMSSYNDYVKFISGDYPEPLVELFGEKMDRTIAYWIYVDLNQKQDGNDEIEFLSSPDKARLIYKTIFGEEAKTISVGCCELSSTYKKRVMEVSNMLDRNRGRGNVWFT